MHSAYGRYILLITTRYWKFMCISSFYFNIFKNSTFLLDIQGMGLICSEYLERMVPKRMYGMSKYQVWKKIGWRLYLHQIRGKHQVNKVLFFNYQIKFLTYEAWYLCLCCREFIEWCLFYKFWNMFPLFC